MDIIKQAIKLWTGYGIKSFPSRDDNIILNKYGIYKGTRLLQEIKELEKIFYQSTAFQTAEDLITMSEICKRDFLVKYPDINPEISEVLAWCYTFDYK